MKCRRVERPGEDSCSDETSTHGRPEAIDRKADRLLDSPDAVTGSDRRQPAGTQRSEEFVERERGSQCRGDLDGERQLFEHLADVGGQRDVGHMSARGLGAVEEQLSSRRRRQRSEPEDVLTGDIEDAL